MTASMDCPLAGVLAERLRKARDEVTHRWLERISARVTLDRNQIFPTEDLLDHIPLLIDGIADYMEDPADEISADMPVVDKATELGELRLSQGFSATEILKEYEILGGVLFSFLVHEVESVDEECTRGELLACGKRLFRAIAVIQQITTAHYLRVAAAEVSGREQRLRGFNRTVTHELKTGLGAIMGAVNLLKEPTIEQDPEQRKRFIEIIVRNTEGLHTVLADLLTLSGTTGSTRQRRNVLLEEAIAESARQLREMAQRRGVEIRVAGDIPPVEVDAAAVELCVTNYLSNGIKYADPDRTDRQVAVRAYCVRTSDTDREAIIEVRDNGIGVPTAARDRLFERFFRAHDHSDVDGTGLGLSIVRETVEAIGGRAWAETPDDDGDGSIFKLAIPARRQIDTPADHTADPADHPADMEETAS